MGDIAAARAYLKGQGIEASNLIEEKGNYRILVPDQETAQKLKTAGYKHEKEYLAPITLTSPSKGNPFWSLSISARTLQGLADE